MEKIFVLLVLPIVAGAVIEGLEKEGWTLCITIFFFEKQFQNFNRIMFS